jgi:tetratricopeptide (TPR) repeat protein
MKLGDGLNLLGDREGARQAFLGLVKSQDVPPTLMALARTKLADALLRSNDRAGAAEQLKAIVREDPSNATANFFLGQIAIEQQQWAEAAEYLKKVLVFNPQLEQAYYDLARAQIGAGDNAGAVATLEVARGKYSSNFVIEFLTATAHSGMKDHAGAIRHYTRAEIVAGATNDKRLTSGFYFQFGAALERNGNRDEAEKYFEKCLALAPGDAEALNYLGFMWAEQGVNLERAKDLIGRALKAEPDNEAFLDSMGWVLFKLNQPAPALEFLLKAVAKSGEPDATLYDHLGDIHAALQQMEKAREAWARSLGRETNDIVRKKLEGATTPATK